MMRHHKLCFVVKTVGQCCFIGSNGRVGLRHQSIQLTARGQEPGVTHGTSWHESKRECSERQQKQGLVKEVSFEQHTIPGTEAVPLTGYNVQQLWLQLFAA